MKKVLITLVILVAPFVAIAQNETTNTPAEEVITVTSTQEEVKTEVASSETAQAKFKAQVYDMNYKKSNDIISIKAYRKSLQVKVKEVKLC